MKNYAYSDLRKLSHKLLQFNLTPMITISLVYLLLNWLCLNQTLIVTLFSTTYMTLIMYVAFKSMKSEKVSLNNLNSRELSDVAKVMLRYLVLNLAIFVVTFLCGIMFTFIFGGMLTLSVINGNIGSMWFAILLIILIGLLIVYISLRLSLVLPILMDTPSLTIVEAIKEGASLMKGHVFEYICFELTFIGWLMVVIITCGIGCIYVAPLLVVSDLVFYCVLQRKPIAYEEGVLK